MAWRVVKKRLDATLVGTVQAGIITFHAEFKESILDEKTGAIIAGVAFDSPEDAIRSVGRRPVEELFSELGKHPERASAKQNNVRVEVDVNEWEA